jgi:hypothetical protein
MRYVDAQEFAKLTDMLARVARTSKTSAGLNIAVKLDDNRVAACAKGALVSLLNDAIMTNDTVNIPMGFGGEA